MGDLFLLSGRPPLTPPRPLPGSHPFRHCAIMSPKSSRDLEAAVSSAVQNIAAAASACSVTTLIIALSHPNELPSSLTALSPVTPLPKLCGTRDALGMIRTTYQSPT